MIERDLDAPVIGKPNEKRVVPKPVRLRAVVDNAVYIRLQRIDRTAVLSVQDSIKSLDI